MSCPTTPTTPRSLAEAWPREHANPIEVYPGRARGILWAAAGIGAAILIGAILAIGV